MWTLDILGQKITSWQHLSPRGTELSPEDGPGRETAGVEGTVV